MDQGVIQALKACFRKSLVQRMLVCMSQDKEYKVDILGAIHLIAFAWRELTGSTIANCFRHAGFSSNDQTSDMPDFPECDSEDDATEKQDLLEQCALREIPLDFDEYVHIDSDVATCPENTVESIVAEVCNEEEEDEPEEASQEEEASQDPTEAATTLQGAELAVQALKTFFPERTRIRNVHAKLVFYGEGSATNAVERTQASKN